MPASFSRPLIGMLVGTLLIMVAVQFTSLVSTPAVEAAIQAGYHDTNYPSTIIDSTNSQYPTGEKPQSKLWYNDGIWWAVMYSTANSSFDIFKLNWPATWQDTGVAVDNRGLSRADCLWDGTNLYVVSGVYNASGGSGGRFYRYSYNSTAKSYTLDAGFPTAAMTGNAEALVLDKDSTGALWITFTQGNKVYVNVSSDQGATWGTPFVIPGALDVYADDISAVVAFHATSSQNGVGVVWSSHNTTGGKPDPTAALYFAYHLDGAANSAWQIKLIYQGQCVSDDHINLKSIQADANGRIFAAVKTSLADPGCSNPPPPTPSPARTATASPTTAQIRLLVIDSTGLVKQTVFGTKADDHTRPIILLDPADDRLYMFATSPTSSGAIYMKSTSMSNPDFSGQTGKGTAFIANPQGLGDTKINNATSTKQTISAASGLVVLASDESSRFYVHNVIDLGNAPTSTTTNTPAITKTSTATAPSGATSTPTATATFTATSTPTATATGVVGSATTTMTASPTITNTPTSTSGLTSASPTVTATRPSPGTLGPHVYLPEVVR